MPVSERVDRSTGPVPRRAAIAVIWVQAYLIFSYLFVGPLAYAWRETALSEWLHSRHWLALVAGLLFGLTGFFVTVLDAFIAGLLIVAGGAAWAAGRRRISTGLEDWLGLTTAVSLAFLVFSLTPLGHAIQLWVLD